MKDSEADNRSLPSNSRSSLRELIGLYVKLGTIGFGGPQAHIAMQYIEVVERRQWLTQAQFVEGMAICEMLPGPASTQMGIYIGYLCAGQLGAFLAEVSFIAPAFCIVLALSWAYFRYQQTPQLAGLFVGVSPVVVAIIVGFCWKLAAKTVLVKEASPKQRYGRVAIFAAVTVATLLRVNILLQLLLAGLAGLWIFGVWPSPPLRARSWMLPIVLSPFFADVSPDILSLSSVWGTERILAYGWPLALFFLKLGSFIFGGGLVIIPFIESEVVEQLRWLTPTEFLNGVAIGQLSPGPVVLTAAFIGYKVAGVLGALVAAIAIFLPSFAFIMLASPWLAKLRQRPWVQCFLKGVTPAVLGAILAAAIPLAQAALTQPSPVLQVGVVAIALATLVALLKYQTPTWLLVPAGGLAGWTLWAIA